MQCPCGSEMRFASHEVKTEAKAIEWCAEIKTLPITVEQDKCHGCGRISSTIKDRHGTIIQQKG